MPEPELHVRNLAPPFPVTVCESGRHIAHPGDTCEETDELQAAFRAYFERALAEAYANAEQLWLYGNGTGEPRGFLAGAEREPTPVERALAILDPHLRTCPLYKAGPPSLLASWNSPS